MLQLFCTKKYLSLHVTFTSCIVSGCTVLKYSLSSYQMDHQILFWYNPKSLVFQNPVLIWFIKYIKYILERVPLAQAIVFSELTLFINICYIYKNISFCFVNNVIEGHKISRYFFKDFMSHISTSFWFTFCFLSASLETLSSSSHNPTSGKIRHLCINVCRPRA